MSEQRPQEDVSLAQLLRGARDTYREAVREALDAAGCDDIPRSGVFVFESLRQSATEASFTPQAELVSVLGLSKQGSSQLIDTLVLRAYLERRNDPEDRRRMEVRLTERGRKAAAAIKNATDAVEAAVAQLVSADDLRGFRASLAAYRVNRERSGD